MSVNTGAGVGEVDLRVRIRASLASEEITVSHSFPTAAHHAPNLLSVSATLLPTIFGKLPFRTLNAPICRTRHLVPPSLNTPELRRGRSGMVTRSLPFLIRAWGKVKSGWAGLLDYLNQLEPWLLPLYFFCSAMYHYRRSSSRTDHRCSQSTIILFCECCSASWPERKRIS
jgi:hypothetical protein